MDYLYSQTNKPLPLPLDTVDPESEEPKGQLDLQTCDDPDEGFEDSFIEDHTMPGGDLASVCQTVNPKLQRTPRPASDGPSISQVTTKTSPRVRATSGSVSVGPLIPLGETKEALGMQFEEETDTDSEAKEQTVCILPCTQFKYMLLKNSLATQLITENKIKQNLDLFF